MLLFAEGGRLPFDVAPLRALPYRLTSEGRPDNLEGARAALVQAFRAARDGQTDSPVFQLLDGLPDPQLDNSKPDVFRERVRYSTEVKERLVADVELGVMIELFLSYRAVRAWEDMIRLVENMPPPLAATVMVQEQLALALNRAGRGDEAERVLRALIDPRGPSRETYGILGRVYKDCLGAAKKRAMPSLRIVCSIWPSTLTPREFEVDWRPEGPQLRLVSTIGMADLGTWRGPILGTEAPGNRRQSGRTPTG